MLRQNLLKSILVSPCEASHSPVIVHCLNCHLQSSPSPIIYYLHVNYLYFYLPKQTFNFFHLQIVYIYDCGKILKKKTLIHENFNLGLWENQKTKQAYPLVCVCVYMLCLSTQIWASGNRVMPMNNLPNLLCLCQTAYSAIDFFWASVFLLIQVLMLVRCHKGQLVSDHMCAGAWACGGTLCTVMSWDSSYSSWIAGLRCGEDKENDTLITAPIG